MTDYTEIEVKLRVPSLDAIHTELEREGAVLKHPRVYEHNARYDTPEHTMAPQGIVLRLRQDHVARLTFKKPQDPVAKDRGIHQRFEAEVEVSDFKTADLILRELGYEPFMIYEKYRTTFELDAAEVVLDEMPYGPFVEIEAANEEAINDTITRLGLDLHIRYPHSYAVLFDFVRANLGLSFRDLTFENFQGIDVPVSAFEPPGE